LAQFPSSSGIQNHPSASTLHYSFRPCEYSFPTAITEVQTMANPEHLKILKQGVTAWNRWIQKRPRADPEADGSGDPQNGPLNFAINVSHIERADLSGANLKEFSPAGGAVYGKSTARVSPERALNQPKPGKRVWSRCPDLDRIWSLTSST
jgi:hypothetical protein